MESPQRGKANDSVSKGKRPLKQGKEPIDWARRERKGTHEEEGEGLHILWEKDARDAFVYLKYGADNDDRGVLKRNKWIGFQLDLQLLDKSRVSGLAKYSDCERSI